MSNGKGTSGLSRSRVMVIGTYRGVLVPSSSYTWIAGPVSSGSIRQKCGMPAAAYFSGLVVRSRSWDSSETTSMAMSTSSGGTWVARCQSRWSSAHSSNPWTRTSGSGRW